MTVPERKAAFFYQWPFGPEHFGAHSLINGELRGDNMEKWVVTAKRADFNDIGRRFNIDPVIARCIRNRDIVGDEAIREYLYGDLTYLHDPMLLLNMDKAVRILRKKIADGARIRIIGDYDIDGIMSSYILKRGLTELGANVDVKIPNRVTDGYGINESLIREAYKDGTDTIVTCDNGISAGPQIKVAKELGMTVIVTDHHEVLSVPEAADAVIDAKQEGDTYPYKEMCGAGVAWKLILAMGGDPGYDLLPYVAFATVGDIVDLTGENRILVKEGIARLHSVDNPGLRALARECRIELSKIDTYHIGFILGPCLNASGRLDTAMRACALLEERDEAEAGRLARELKDLNDSRKAMTEEGVALACDRVEAEGIVNDKVFVIFLPEVHESLAGIVAGRVRERYNHPVFVLTRGEEGVKGSGRSIESYPMFDALVGVSHLLTKFGGHPMAAGLSLPEENIGLLRRELNEQCTLTEEDFVEKVKIDVPMPVSYVTENLIEQLSLLEPFGKANPKPAFAEKGVVCAYPRIFGANKNVVKARILTPSGRPGPDLISFRDAEELKTAIDEKGTLSIVYYPQINDYMGIRTIQIAVTRFM